MLIKTTNRLYSLLNVAETLGIEHGLDESKIFAASFEFQNTEYKRLSKLIAEERERIAAQRKQLSKERAELIVVVTAFGTDPQALDNLTVQELRDLALKNSYKACSVTRSVRSVSILHKQLVESEFEEKQVSPWLVEGLMDIAELSIRHSILSYDGDPRQALENENYQNITFVSNQWPDTQTLLFTYDGYAFVVFRGTAGLRDVLIDLHGLRVRKPGRHAGFQKAWDSVSGEISDWLEQRMQEGFAGVVFSGHSLGGALAILSAYDLSTRFPVQGIFTFGSPRVGNAEFQVDYTKRLHEKTWRFETGTDIITWLVPRWLGYRHVGNRVSILNRGSLRFHSKAFSSNWERDEKRSEISFRLSMEQRVRDRFERLPLETQNFVKGLPWELSKAGTWLVIVYFALKFISIFVWIARRLGKDISDHGKDESYGWAISDCAVRLNENRWSNDPVEGQKKRASWLNIGSKLPVTRPPDSPFAHRRHR